MNYKIIARLLGILMIVLALVMATAIAWTIYFREPKTTLAFILSSVVTLFFGFGLYYLGRKELGAIGRREALLVVTVSWFLTGLFGAIPYILDGAFTNFAEAFFETVSGFATAGSTVLTDIESLSHGLHYWRTLTHWLGGMGIVVLFIAIFPQLGVGAKHLFKSETPGPITEGLKPQIKETASTLWKIYLGLTAAECALLYMAGLSFFDALCHSFATLATGGFSTKNASIAHFNSVAVELIIIVFMFLAGINFSLYYAFIKGNFAALFKSAELRVYATIVVLATCAITLNILVIHSDFLTALRYASFQVISIVSTTGFGTDNFDLYPAFSRVLLVMLMIIGGSAGSTSGGMKISRIIVIAKAAFVECYKIFRPQAVKAVKIGKSVMSDEITKSIFGFFTLYLLVIVFGSLFMSLLGLDIITASTAVITTLGGVGPGLAQVGPIENFAFIPTVGKIFLSLCMILGRLELYTVLVLLVPDFWKR
ncbi:TrkH family potassium uptake protein [candidate division KSB1 bacterium]|nr:TrkH family potassium uptake protein [candidate division KSB1 bacterium]